MTKALPTCCIKDNDDLSWKTFNVLLEIVDLEDKIGHLYIVNIMFDAKNTFKKQLVYNEIYPPIIQKQKIIDPCARSVFQILEQYVEGTNNNPLAYRATAKAHATILKKNYSNVFGAFSICN